MIGSVTTYGGLSLTQAAMTYAVSPLAGAPTADDQSQASQDVAPAAQQATVAPQLAASDISLTSASMSALIAAQASISQDAPMLIRRHTAQDLGEMIWNLDDAPPLSPAPMAVRRLQAAQAALNASLVDLKA